jgi:hypothetical protein
MQAQVSNDSEAPCTRPRSEDCEEHNTDSDDDSTDHDIEEQDDESGLRNVQRGRHTWEVLATFDQTAMLVLEVSAAILRIADEKIEQSGLVEWPSARIPSNCIGLCILGHSYTRLSGIVEI